MDFVKLEQFIKKAMQASSGYNQVSPEDVAAEMQKKQQTSTEDKDTETVDGEVIDDGHELAENNQEGQMLEQAFPELEVEDAIEKAKETKKLQGDGGVTIKSAGNYWELLKLRYGINCR